MARQINFTTEELNKEYFSEKEYTEIITAAENDELFESAAIIADKVIDSDFLKFNDEQKARWRSPIIQRICNSQFLNFVMKMGLDEQKFFFKMLFLDNVQNFAEAKKNHQDSLNNPPPAE